MTAIELAQWYQPDPTTEPETKRKSDFSDYIQQIYNRRINSKQFDKHIGKFSLEQGFGSIYSIIRDKLQQVCRKHRNLIAGSAEALAKNNSLYMTPPMTGVQDDGIQMYESIVCIIYHHFRSVAESNKQICQIWDIIRNKNVIESTPNDSSLDFNIKTPELRLSTLNLLATKEMIPTSVHLNLSNFKDILLKIKSLSSSSAKAHIDQLLVLYKDEPSTKSTVPSIKSEKIPEALREKPNHIKTQRPTNNKVQKTDWLKKIKQTPMGRIFSEKFGGKLSELQQEQIIISEEDKKFLMKGLLPNNIFRMGTSCQRTKTTIYRNSVKIEINKHTKHEFQFQIMDNEALDEDRQDFKLDFRLEGDDYQQEVLKKMESSNTNAIPKKKKNKNKKKNAKKQQNANMQQQGSAKQEKQNNEISNQTINLFRKMVIDKQNRQNCHMEARQLADWKQWADKNIDST